MVLDSTALIVEPIHCVGLIRHEESRNVLMIFVVLSEVLEFAALMRCWVPSFEVFLLFGEYFDVVVHDDERI